MTVLYTLKIITYPNLAFLRLLHNKCHYQLFIRAHQMSMPSGHGELRPVSSVESPATHEGRECTKAV